MNGDALQLSQQIQLLQTTLLHEISEVKQSCAGIEATLTSEVHAIKSTHDAFRNELLGDGGRVSEIEDEQKRADTRQWIHSAILIPVGAVLHTIASKMGLTN